MASFFHTTIYQPLFNLLVVFYNFIPGHDLGIVIIFLALLIELIFYPLKRKAARHQKLLQAISPQLKKLQEKHKNSPETLSQETMKLWKESGTNPLGGCLPLLAQLPILIGLFQVFRTGFTPEALSNLYSFVQNPGTLNPFFLGFLDLSQRSIVVALLAAGAQLIQGLAFPLTPKSEGEDKGVMGQAFGKQMIFMAPLITFGVSYTLPSALPFYWFFNALFAIIEGVIIKRYPS